MDIEKYIEALRDQPGINSIHELVSECKKHPLPPGWEYEFSFPELVETENGYEWRTTAIPVRKYCVRSEQPVSDHHEIEVEFRGEKVTISREFYRDGEMNYSTSEQDDNAIWSALRAWCEKKGITPFELYPKQSEQPVLPGIDEEGIPGRDFIPVEWVEACERYGIWEIVKKDKPEPDVLDGDKTKSPAQC